MTSPQAPASGSSYGSAADWSQVISGASEGASSAMKGAAAHANSKREAKEAKRRTLANLLSQAMKRNQALFKTGQDYTDDMTDQKSQVMQNVARGFVNSIQGS